MSLRVLAGRTPAQVEELLLIRREPDVQTPYERLLGGASVWGPARAAAIVEPGRWLDPRTA